MSHHHSTYQLLILSLFLFHLIGPLAFPVLRVNFMADALMSESKELMSGKLIRIVMIHSPPALIVSKGSDGNEVYSGALVELMNYIKSALNVSYEYVRVSEADVVKYGYGPSQFNQILNGAADMMANGLVMSHAKFLDFDIGSYMVIEPFRMLVPWPREESRLLAPIRPFQLPVWISLGISIVILVPVLSFVAGFYHRYMQQRENGTALDDSRIRRSIISFFSLLHNASFLLSHITNQGYHYNLRLRSRGSYILVGVWCLMAVVLANAYAGVLFSFLSVSKLQPVLNSLEEVAYSKDVTFLVIDRSELALRLLEAKNGYEKVIGDQLRANPSQLISTMAQVKKYMMNGLYAFPYINIYTRGLMAATYRENGKKCRVTYAKEAISQFSPIAQLMAKNGPYTQAINEQIQAQTEGGLIDFYMRQQMPRVDQCLMENQKASTRQKALSLADMASAFVVLGLGVSLAVLVYLFELIYKRINDHYFKDKVHSYKITSTTAVMTEDGQTNNRNTTVNQVTRLQPLKATQQPNDEIETHELT